MTPSKANSIHILGICGTFMGSLALLAKALGCKVSGSDANVYPPMSTQLENAGIEIYDGYTTDQLSSDIDEVIIGNALSRGNPLVEHVLNQRIPYTSGPEWLSKNILQNRWVLAISGTHGKTTTTSMLAWILTHAGLQPGFLIGGVPKNFERSAELGSGEHFVIEADEYDSAFFDKRSKFIHYKPKTLSINNLEFDHADIFDDLAAIQKQFHHLVRTIPSEGQIILPNQDLYIEQVIEKGCWTPIRKFSVNPAASNSTPDTPTNYAKLIEPSGNKFEIYTDQEKVGQVEWQLTGLHNVCNALSALLAAEHAGVPLPKGIEALCKFQGVTRRMEIIARTDTVCLYDDFAHHPTAIETTLAGLRNQVGEETIKVIIEPRSNTMQMGMHNDTILASLQKADEIFWYDPGNLAWELKSVTKNDPKSHIFDTVPDIISKLFQVEPSSMEHWVIMSNGGFNNIHQKIKSRLS